MSALVSTGPTCPLCRDAGGDVVWRDEFVRIVLPDEPDLPALVRVILEAHHAEMTDLAPDARARTMRAVWAVEASLREVLAPDKINVASLGNQVPHVHWHVVPRWNGDTNFMPAVARTRVLSEDLHRNLDSLRSSWV